MIPDRSLVYVTSLMGTPTAVVEAMAAESDRWSALETTSDYLIEPLATFDHPSRPFRHLTVQPSRALEAMAEAGALRTVSGCSSQFARLYRPGGALAVDVAVVQVSRPGPDGRFSLGTSGGATAELVRSAPVVLAEINPTMPYTRGATECDRTDFDALVEVDAHPLVELPVGPGGDVATKIGEHVASLVRDGAVIEYGIGAIPDAALAALANHANLGLHSGMLGDAAARLIDAGVMNGAGKAIDTGLHVTSALVGTAKVAQWADGRDDVIMVGSGYSHGVPALANQDRFTAINSAVEVAVDGSINAEVAGGRVVSGPGGQPDFAVGAALAADGVSVVALPATARGGTRSRIVRSISSDHLVTVPHFLADRVVTEFGVAALAGADRSEREARLLAIAAPGIDIGSS